MSSNLTLSGKLACDHVIKDSVVIRTHKGLDEGFTVTSSTGISSLMTERLTSQPEHSFNVVVLHVISQVLKNNKWGEK